MKVGTHARPHVACRMIMVHVDSLVKVVLEDSPNCGSVDAPNATTQRYSSSETCANFMISSFEALVPLIEVCFTSLLPTWVLVVWRGADLASYPGWVRG